MGGINPIVLLLAMGKGLGGNSLIRKVLFYSMFGWIGLLIGGGFSVKDLLLIPMIAPMLSGIFGGGAGAPAPGGSLV